MYNTVIFDLDGTLLNTIDDLADAVRHVQDKFGWELHSTETVKKHVGNGIRNLLRLSIPDGFDNPYFEEAFNTFKEFYQKNCMVKTCPYPGIIDLLKELKKKEYKMAIVSNKAHSAVLELSQNLFAEYIDIALGENEAGGIKKKPAADMVNLALEKLGSNKTESIYVGDSEVDKATADNSEMDCVLCQWGFRPLSLLQELAPKAIISTPLELIDILEKTIK